jgi:hypothetical protein
MALSLFCLLTYLNIVESNEPLLLSGEQFSQVTKNDYVGKNGGKFPLPHTCDVVVLI